MPERVAERAVARARQRGASRRELKALLLAGITESRLQHGRYRSVGSGDRDSVGFLQQRPSQGWGPAGESIERDTDQFLDRAMKINGRGFRGSAGQLAQAVQRSGFPGRYDTHSGEADRLIDRLGGGMPAPAANAKASAFGSGGGGGLAGLLAPAGRSAVPITPPAAPSFAAGVKLPGGGLPAPSGGAPAVRAPVGGLGARLGQDVDFTPERPGGEGSGGSGTGSEGGSTSAPGDGGEGTFKITGPNPGRLQPALRQFARQVAGVFGEPIVGSDGTGHSKYTTSGNVSDHFAGNASDIPASGRRLLRLGRAALIAAGMPRAQAMKQRGGLFNVNGHQIIFLTDQGGNHYDHLHISARPGRSRRRGR